MSEEATLKPPEVFQSGPPSIIQSTPSRTKVPVTLGRPLTDLDAAWRLAMNMAQARNIGKDIRGNAADIFLVFMWGAELSIGPAQALANIRIVNGAPVLLGQLLSGLVRRAGHKLEEVESDDKHALVRLTRNDGQVWEAEWTIDDAIRAKLVYRRDDGTLVSLSQNNKELPWQLYTPDMLYWRALGRVVRRGCSEVTLGAYIEGEVEHEDAPVDSAKVFTAMSEPSQEDMLAEVKAIETMATEPMSQAFLIHPDAVVSVE